MKKNKTSLILYGICAAMWSITAVIDVINRYYKESVLLFVLHLLCAVIWIAAFAVLLKKYRVENDQ